MVVVRFCSIVKCIKFKVGNVGKVRINLDISLTLFVVIALNAPPLQVKTIILWISLLWLLVIALYSMHSHFNIKISCQSEKWSLSESHCNEISATNYSLSAKTKISCWDYFWVEWKKRRKEMKNAKSIADVEESDLNGSFLLSCLRNKSRK